MRRKTYRVLMAVVASLILFALAAVFGPLRYEYGSDAQNDWQHGQVQTFRINRFNGQKEYWTAEGWTSNTTRGFRS